MPIAAVLLRMEWAPGTELHRSVGLLRIVNRGPPSVQHQYHDQLQVRVTLSLYHQQLQHPNGQHEPLTLLAP